MKHTKIITALLFIVTLLMFTSMSVAAVKKPSKTTFTKKTYTKSHKQRTQPVRTKEYRVPGPSAISYAKRHGYTFPEGKRRVEIKKRRFRLERCKFMGMHWQVDPNTKCYIWGFSTSKEKCKNLRKGWKMKQMQISGNFVWTNRPANNTNPDFQIFAENNGATAKAISIRRITLIGPEGPANKWQEAFDHCSDPSYRP